MSNKPQITVNRKFVFIFVSIQIIITGLILFALLSPKTVTVHVERVERSFQIEVPLEIVVPQINR